MSDTATPIRTSHRPTRLMTASYHPPARTAPAARESALREDSCGFVGDAPALKACPAGPPLWILLLAPVSAAIIESMLTFTGEGSTRTCDGLTRRDFLQA